MKIKKIFITGAVIVVGLMVGIIFSTYLPSLNEKRGNSSNNFENNSSTQKKGFSAVLTAKPLVIKAIQESNDLKRLANSEKSLLTIQYANNTSFDLTEVQILASGTGTNFGFSASKDAKYNKDVKIENTKYSVFTMNDIKKGQTGTVSLNLFSRQQGLITINTEIKTKEINSTKTNSAAITAN